MLVYNPIQYNVIVEQTMTITTSIMTNVFISWLFNWPAPKTQQRKSELNKI